MNKYNKRNLIALWSAQTISQAGDAIYQFALLWLVLDMTDSPAVTGLIAMSAYLPALFLGLFAGVLSDRINRYFLMIGAHVSQSLTVMAIPVLIYFDMATGLFIGIVAFIRSGFSTFFQPAFNAFVPMLFPSNRLVRVNSILVTSGQIAYILGPALAGVLLAVISLPNLFILDSVSFLVAIGFLMIVVKPKQERIESSHSHWKELTEGLHLLKTTKPLLVLMIITFINNLFIMGPAIVGVPVLVRNALGGTASDFAFVEACMAGGSLIGSLIVTRLNKRLSNGVIWTIGMLLDGITYSIFYFAQSIPMVMIMIFIHGIGIPFIIVSRTVIIQQNAPNRFHGRLFSMVHLGVVGMTALSSATIGLSAMVFPIQSIFLFIGIGATLCGLYGISLKHIRHLA
ncbi:MAG: MFS transporter [Candidatus Marinimicrobia bacterium]|nr:MFS transporter [Candidatus Neomarinimicrobiota bacterium]